MLKSYIKSALLTAAVILSNLGAAFANGDDILRRVDEIRAPGSNFSFDVKVTTGSGASMRMNVIIKDQTKGLVQYVSPAKSAGRSILFVGRNMWVHVPGGRRALRISPQQQVLGGVSSADVARTVYSADYAVAGVDSAGEGKQVLHLNANSRAAAYGKIDLTVAADSSKPLMAVFYSANGRRMLKTVYFEGYKTVLGRKRPTRLRVVDHMAGDAVTTMVYSSYRMQKTPEAWFQPSYLSRL